MTARRFLNASVLIRIIPVFPLLCMSACLDSNMRPPDQTDDAAGAATANHLLSEPSAFQLDRSIGGIAAADMTGDGFPDVVTYAPDSKELLILRSDRTGGLDETGLLAYPLALMPSAVQLADFDGDGDFDVAVGVHNESGTQDVTLGMLLNDGTGGFDEVVWYSGGVALGVSMTLLPLDIDNDGDVDIVATGAANLVTFVNDNHGGFAEQTVNLGITNTGVVESIDLDHDGDDDVVVLHSSSVLDVLYNDAAGDAAGQETPGIVRAGGTIEVADVNGDGIDDLLVGNRFELSLSGLPDSPALIETQCTGDFDILMAVDAQAFEVKTFDAGGAPVSLSAGDIDADGDTDIVVANLGCDDVSVLINRGDGTFDEQRVDVAADPASIILVDMDLDGDLDVVTSHEGMPGTVSVALNRSIGDE